MQPDKFTIKSQEAIQAAQQLAQRAGATPRSRRSTCSPVLLEQEGGDRRAGAAQGWAPRRRTFARARTPRSTSFPQVSGAAASEARPSGELVRVFQAAEPAGAQAQGRVHLDRAPAAGARGARRARVGDGPDRLGRDAARRSSRRCGGARPAPRDRPQPRGQVPGARALRPRPDRAGRAGQARPRDRPRRGDPARDPGAVAAHQEQPGADRRPGRRQDGDRRGPGAADRVGRHARVAARPPRRRARHRRADRRQPSTAASSRTV